MAVSTFEIAFMLILFIILGIVLWWFIIAEKYRKYLADYSNTRGANALRAGQTLNLSCDQDKEICVYRATQICSKPDPTTNFEISPLEPISSGVDGSGVSYGEFNPHTTVELTKDLSGKCNGKSTCSYIFQPKPFSNNSKCPPSNTQLISTYTCIPKGGTCRAHKNIK